MTMCRINHNRIRPGRVKRLNPFKSVGFHSYSRCNEEIFLLYLSDF